MENTESEIVNPRLSEDALIEEIKSIRKRANYFRKSGISILFIIAVLMGFGGYVFFAANEITIREVSSVRKAELNSNLEMLKRQSEQLDALRAESIDQKMQSEKQSRDLKIQLIELKKLQESIRKESKKSGL